MKTAAGRACALALLLLGLASAAPPLVAPETEALPAFDDADGSDGAAAPILFLSSPAVLPSAAPRFDAPSDGPSEERVLEKPVPEDAASGTLVSRAPPRA